MRKVVLLAALGAALAPVQAQVSIVRTGSDSIRILMAQGVTVEDVRALRAEFEALFADLQRVQARYGDVLTALRTERDREAVRDRLVSAQREVMRAYDQVQPKQSQLMLACAALRSASRGREGYLGITFGSSGSYQMITPPGGGMISLSPSPVRVDFVEPGSPAERAGVRVGEEWVALGGRRVGELTDRDYDEILKPGARVVMRLRSDDRERDVNVVVGRRPAFPEKECESIGGVPMLAPFIAMLPRDVEQRAVRVPPTPQIEAILPQMFVSADIRVATFGAVFRMLSADVREVVKVDGDGVLVDQVSTGTPAHAAGLKVLDVVTHVNSQVVRTPIDLRRLVEGERTLVLTVMRGGESRTVTLARDR